MKTITFLFLILLVGCASKQLIKGAEKIRITNTKPSETCVFLGEVSGSQGNMWTADITPDKAIIQGARNDLRNKALALGANFVVTQDASHSENTSWGSGGVYNSTLFGDAFKCP